MNVQFAIQDDEVYVLEVNPHYHHAQCHLSPKATGLQLAKIAAHQYRRQTRQTRCWRWGVLFYSVEEMSSIR